MSEPRLRTSRALVFVLEDGHLVGRNFLIKKGFRCPPSWVGVFEGCWEWQSESRVTSILTAPSASDPLAEIAV